MRNEKLGIEVTMGIGSLIVEAFRESPERCGLMLFEVV